MLTFDSEKHYYFWNGKRVPGVSEILKTCGLGRTYEDNERGQFYRDRGIATHKCIQLSLKGTLDENSIDDNVAPYYKQAKDWFLRNLGGSWETETMYYSMIFGFAGTIDLITDSHIYDWKCTKNVDPVAEIQGAFYKQLVLENTLTEMDFSVIQLNGTDWPAEPIPMDASLELVSAVMTLYKRWKRK